MNLTRRIGAVLAMVALCCPALSGDAAAERLFFWKVTGAKGTAFLFGTMHAGRAELYPLPDAVEKAFSEADVLVAELAETAKPEQVGGELLAKARLPAGDNLAQHLTAETRDRLAAYLAQSGFPAAGTANLKPWAVGLLVVPALEIRRLGLDESLGLDKHFIDAAKTMNKPVLGLETIEAQIGLLLSFDALAEAAQDQLLLAGLKQSEAKDMSRVIEAWKSGNAAVIEEIETRYLREFPTLEPLMDRLVYRRNAEMAEKIDRMLQEPRSYFIAVGAMHLIGERGLVSDLQRRNYQVERQ